MEVSLTSISFKRPSLRSLYALALYLFLSCLFYSIFFFAIGNDFSSYFSEIIELNDPRYLLPVLAAYV